MKRLWIIVLILPCLAVAPLSDSQRTRLATANDHSRTIDESAFYALLENADQWEDPTEAGATVPDYETIRSDPEAWRGRLCVIEGRLETALPPPDLARSGWDGVRGLVLRVADGRPIIVYLIHPPELHPTWLSEDYLRERGAQVRVVARFFKLLDRPSRGPTGQGGEVMTYPVFVGHSVGRMDRSDPTGYLAAFVLIAVVIGGVALYLLWRLWERGRRGRGGKLESLLNRREAARRAHGEEEPAEEQSEDLPPDPAEALEAMSRRRQRHQPPEANHNSET